MGTEDRAPGAKTLKLAGALVAVGTSTFVAMLCVRPSGGFDWWVKTWVLWGGAVLAVLGTAIAVAYGLVVGVRWIRFLKSSLEWFHDERSAMTKFDGRWELRSGVDAKEGPKIVRFTSDGRYDDGRGQFSHTYLVSATNRPHVTIQKMVADRAVAGEILRVVSNRRLEGHVAGNETDRRRYKRLS